MVVSFLESLKVTNTRAAWLQSAPFAFACGDCVCSVAALPSAHRSGKSRRRVQRRAEFFFGGSVYLYNRWNVVADVAPARLQARRKLGATFFPARRNGTASGLDRGRRSGAREIDPSGLRAFAPPSPQLHDAGSARSHAPDHRFD